MPSVQPDFLVDGDLVMHSHEAGDITGLVLHDPVTIGTNTASALSLSGQELSLEDKFVQLAGDTMTGALTITPTANSTATLNITNQAGISLLNVDTTNSKTTLRGATAVTVVGAELVTNGDFANDSAWTFGTNWAHDGTALTGKHTAGNTATLSQAITVTNGAVYYVAFQIKTRTAGSVTVKLNNTAAGVTYNSSDTFAPVITAGASGGLVFTPSSDFDGSIDNVSVKLVTPAPNSIDLKDNAGTTQLEWRLIDGVAIGTNALRYLSLASNDNVAIGKNALALNVTSVRNVAIGSNALARLSVVSTGYNVAIGANSLAVNETGVQNVAIGYDTLRVAKYSINNVAIGHSALSTYDGRNPDGNTGNNVAIGTQALSRLTVGYSNTAIGSTAMQYLTTGIGNLSLGGAMGKLITGNYNVGLGNASMYNATTGGSNVGIGAYTMTGVTTESSNVAIGAFSGAGIGGVGNTFIGASVGYLNLTVKAGRDYNTIIGYLAARNLAGDNNVFIGYKAGYNETGSDRLYIANSDTSTPLIYGLFTGAGAGITIHSQNTAGIPLTVKGIASQATYLQEWEDSSGTALARIDQYGGMVINEDGNASGDFRVESDTEANMIFLDANADTDGALYLGGSTNGIKINKGGVLTFLGTANISGGATGSFTTTDGKTVTVTGGIITAIV